MSIEVECEACKRVRPLEAFRKNSRSDLGRSRSCRDCQALARRAKASGKGKRRAKRRAREPLSTTLNAIIAHEAEPAFAALRLRPGYGVAAELADDRESITLTQETAGEHVDSVTLSRTELLAVLTRFEQWARG